MSRNRIIRAWKNPAYRDMLAESERALLPEHPAGKIDLSESGLDAVSGGKPCEGPLSRDRTGFVGHV
jgi:mersacidin/lichenicidin family type 2 lantibiotic